MKPFIKKFSLAFTLAAFVFVFLLAGLGVTAAVASNALPGDPLYGVKTGMEQTRLQLTKREMKKVELNLAYAQKRLDEISSLIAQGRLSNVDDVVTAYETCILEALSGLEAIRSTSLANDAQLDNTIARSLGKYTTELEHLSGRVHANRAGAFNEAIRFSRSAGAYYGKLEFIGMVDSISDNLWIVSGLEVIITSSTKIESNIQVGQQVEVEGWVDAMGSIYAREIEHETDPHSYSLNGEGEFLGVVTEIQPTYWVINGLRFEVTPTSKIKHNITVGDFVEVEFLRNSAGEYQLLEAELAFDDNEFHGVVNEIHPTHWIINNTRFDLLPNSKVENGILVGDFVEVEFARNNAGDYYLLEVEFAFALDRQHQHRNRIKDHEIYGFVDEIHSDYWVVNGTRFELLPNSEIERGIKVDDFVEVEFFLDKDGLYYLLEVEFADSEMVGTVNEIQADYWIISGIRFELIPGSQIEWGIKIGDLVEVEFVRNKAGQYYLLEVELEDDYKGTGNGYNHNHKYCDDDDEMEGFVDEIHSDYWVIGGIRFNLLPKSEIEWGIKVGDYVEVEFFKNSAGEYFLLEVEREDD